MDISAPKPVRAFFNSFAQVVFIENVISGIIILLAFFVAGLEGTGWDFASFNSYIYGIFAIIGAVVGNVTAKMIGNDEDAIASGLFGFCPVLVALGAAVFCGDLTSAFIVCVLGSILVIPVTTIINKMCSRFGLPGFTMPFIVITWFFILISFQTGIINYARNGALVGANFKELTQNVIPELVAPGAFPPAPEEVGIVALLTKGWAEIYILDSVYASVMILVAFFIFRWDFGVKAIIAVAFSIALGYALQVDMNSLYAGLYSYNAILVMGAMETFSTSKDNPTRYWLLVLLGLTLGVLIDYALPSIVGTFGCPSLTFPFVAAGWLTLYFEKEFFAA